MLEPGANVCDDDTSPGRSRGFSACSKPSDTNAWSGLVMYPDTGQHQQPQD